MLLRMNTLAQDFTLKLWPSIGAVSLKTEIIGTTLALLRNLVNFIATATGKNLSEHLPYQINKAAIDAAVRPHQLTTVLECDYLDALPSCLIVSRCL